jgi:hypothetical protein
MSTTPAQREFAARQLVESRDRFLRFARPLSVTQLAYKTAPDRWSVGENLEHVILVEGRGRGFIETALAQAPQTGRASGYPGNDEGLIAMVRDRSHPRRGPEAVQPRGEWSREELFAKFEATRKETCDLLASTTADLHAHFSQHPIFGDVDCYQWLLILSAHCDRHCAQAEEVAGSEGFPRAAAAG